MMRSLWLGAGWLGILAALVLSLGPAVPQGPVEHADKLMHLAGYATLMFWWAQLYITFPQRVRLAAALVLLGIIIEWLQGFTPTRQPDVWDAAANTTGIILGGWFATHSANLLQLWSRHALKSRGN